MKNKNLIGFIATGIIGVLLIVVVVMIISNNNMLSVVKRSVDYKAMGLGKDKSSIILSAQELYNKKIITKKMYEKNKNSYVKLVLNKKNKLEIDYFYDLIKPVIILNGGTQINVEYQTEYQELGIISALDDLCGDLTSKVKITGEVDTNKLGEYVIAYSVSDLSGNKAEVKRIINVIDSKRPIISLKGLKELTLEVNSEYKESGYSAKDNHDGNLTDLVEIKGIVKNKQIGKYFLTYTVKDTSNNKASATRVINIIDYSKPVITLKGASTIVLEQGMQFIEDGFNVSDKYDADIESKVTVQSNVNMNEIGNYEIVYKVINSKGKESSIIRTVSVIEKSSAQITLNGDLEMSIPINSIFEEPGFSVTDKYDINLPVDIKVYNLKDDTVVDSIDTSAIGEYKIVYEVTNLRELTTYKERLVTVYDLSIGEAILANNGGVTAISAKGSPDFSLIATTNEGMYAMADDYGTSYYFRGAVDNNWVKFADMYWRIVRVNGDNSVKLIYSGTIAPTEAQKVVMTGAGTQIGTQAFNSTYNSAEYVGYMYTLGEQRGLETASPIKTYIENWYASNLASQDNKIADTIFCNDRSTYSGTLAGTNFTGNGVGTTGTWFGAARRLMNASSWAPIGTGPSLVCPHKDDAFTKADTTKGNGKLSQKVGLLTADEAAIAGLATNTANSSNYLYTNSNYWLGSPFGFGSDSLSAREFRVGSSGFLDGYYVSSSLGARAVVSLSSDISSLTGSGTWNNPYVVS